MRQRSTYFSVCLALVGFSASCGGRTPLYGVELASAGSAGIPSEGAAGRAGMGSGGACEGGIGCPAAVCGNQRLEAPEECDDGNLLGGDGCSPTCNWEPTAVTARGTVTCALGSDGSVKCWGDNEFGELGLGDTRGRGGAAREMGRDLPVVNLGAGRRAIAVSGGYIHTCALLADGAVKCWGDNRYGALGLGDTNNRGDQPNEMGDLLPSVALGTAQFATAIAAGDAFTCALLKGGAVKCWGYNYSDDLEQGGQLGLGDTSNRGDQPGELGDQLPGLSLGTGRVATAIAAGIDSACALLDDSTVKCWGFNGFGQLGQGDTANRGDRPDEMGDHLPAIQLGTGRSARAIGVGYGFMCALLDDGHIKCWGLNDSGQLGLGDVRNRGGTPGEMGDNLPAVDLGSGQHAKALAVGFQSACALLDTGRVKCWGSGAYGQLGSNDSQDRGSRPGQMGDNLPEINLGAGRQVKAITAGYSAACALLDNGTVKCWGFGQYGELGLGDTDSRGDDPAELGDQLPAVDVGF